MANQLHTSKIRLCRKCKTPLHEKALHDYCSRCYKIVEDIFDQIREYLQTYPGSTSYEIEQRLGIPLHVINNFVKDGRLIEINNEFINIQCLRCDGLLLSAHYKYCPSCEAEMMKDFLKAKEDLKKIDDKKNENAKMRFRSYWDK